MAVRRSRSRILPRPVARAQSAVRRVRKTREKSDRTTAASSRASVPAPALPETSGKIPPTLPSPSPLEELRSQMLYLQADFDNFRKRVDRDRTGEVARAMEPLLRRLLDVLDGFDTALRTTGKDTDPAVVRQGLEMLQRQLSDAMNASGLERVPSTGVAFDPRKHDAVDRAIDPALPDGQVIAEIRAGYSYGGRVLRPAMVRVNVQPPAPAAPEPVQPGAEVPSPPGSGNPAAGGDATPATDPVVAGPAPSDPSSPSSDTKEDEHHGKDSGN